MSTRDVVASNHHKQCWLAMDTRASISAAGQLDGILGALEESGFVPERFGPDERRLKPYTRKAALAKKPRGKGEWFQMYVRNTAPAFDASIATEPGTGLAMHAFGDRPHELKRAFDLGDELARRVRPRLIAVAVSTERRMTADGPDAETINLIIASGAMYEPKLRKQGVIGLAPRTYLGPSVVELIGRERIESLALPRVWIEGGVRIDLVPEPWQARPEDMVQPWRTAMEILRPSDVFSTIIEVTESGNVIARRGARWH